MNALLSIILNKSFFYNKKIAILFFISLSLVVLVTFFDKGFETNRGDLFLITTLYFGISICLYRLIKEKNYEFHKYSLNTNEYRLSSKKDKEKSYDEVFNRLLSEDLNNIKSSFNISNRLNEFLLDIHNELNKNLRKPITFERFNGYFIISKGNKTTGQLFYTQYRNSLIKIIKDFLIHTNELENASNDTISKFILELTKLKNLNFDSDNGLHYDDKLVFDFLKEIENSSLKKDNPSKDLFTKEIKKVKKLISSLIEQTLKMNTEILSILKKKESKIEQENIIIELKKNIKQIELKNISKSKFYKILEQISIDVLNVKFTDDNKEELKSYVGVFFSSEIDCEFQYKPQIKQLSFINLNNSIDFILSIKYLIKSNLIVNNMSRNMQNLDKVIAENAYKTTAKDRAGIFRNNLFLIDFALEKQENIDYILQTLKVKPK